MDDQFLIRQRKVSTKIIVDVDIVRDVTGRCESKISLLCVWLEFDLGHEEKIYLPFHLTSRSGTRSSNRTSPNLSMYSATLCCLLQSMRTRMNEIGYIFTEHHVGTGRFEEREEACSSYRKLASQHPHLWNLMLNLRGKLEGLRLDCPIMIALCL